MIAEYNRNQEKGKFIVLEGIDGSGLSTQASIIHNWLEQKTERKVLLTKEPSDGPVGVLIRQALIERVQGLGTDTLALLFAADRVDHLTHRIIPALEAGYHVVCDRYLLSSLAYQGRSHTLEWIKQINEKASMPDLTIFVSVSPEISLKRIAEKRFQVDLFERENILQDVLQNYHTMIAELRSAGQKIVEIDGNQPIEAVTENVLEQINKLLL